MQLLDTIDSGGAHYPRNWREQAITLIDPEQGLPPTVSVMAMLRQLTTPFGRYVNGTSLPNWFQQPQTCCLFARAEISTSSPIRSPSCPPRRRDAELIVGNERVRRVQQRPKGQQCMGRQYSIDWQRELVVAGPVVLGKLV